MTPKPKKKKLKDLDHGEIVSFVPEGFFVEVQGRVLQMWEDDEGTKWLTVAMLLRPQKPRDYVSKYHKVYHYYETDEYVDVERKRATRIIPSEVLFPDAEQDNIDYMETIEDPKLLQKGFIFVNQFVNANHELLRPTIDFHTVWCYHFHPRNKQFIGMETDIATAYWGFVKQAIFDPFIGVAAKTTRHKQRNLNLWQMMLNLAPVENFVWNDFLTQCINHPIAKAKAARTGNATITLLTIEPMLAPEDSIPYIMEKLTWIHHEYETLPDHRMHAADFTEILIDWAEEADKNLRKWAARGVVSGDTAKSLMEEEEERELDEVEQQLTGEKHDLENGEQEDDFVTSKIIKVEDEEPEPVVDEEIIESGDETDSDVESVDFRRVKKSDSEEDSSSEDSSDKEFDGDSESSGEEEESEESDDESTETDESSVQPKAKKSKPAVKKSKPVEVDEESVTVEDVPRYLTPEVTTIAAPVSNPKIVHEPDEITMSAVLQMLDTPMKKEEEVYPPGTTVEYESYIPKPPPEIIEIED